MNTSPTPEGDKFDRLLDALPRVAEAVNAFKSEDVQLIAIEALIRAIGIPNTENDEPAVAPPSLSVVPTSEADDSRIREVSETSAANGEAKEWRKDRGHRPRKPATKKTWSLVKDINFRPDGNVSLRDFVAKKEPTSFEQKNLAVVYYLEQILQVGAVTVGHVLAAYKESEWKSPSNPDNSLRGTAHRLATLDTSNMKAIKTTHTGRNMVEYDMPINKEKKSA